METSANTRRGLAALIVKGGGGKSAAPGESAGEILGSADPGAEGAGAAADANGLESDPYVELATEALEAFQANDATALAAIFRAVRGMPEDDSKTTG